MRRWAGAGQPAEAFWRTTPREFVAVVGGVEDRRRADLRLMQATAYSQAVLTGIAMSGRQRMPKFERVFPDPFVAQRAQSGEETLAVVRAWAAAVNGTSGNGTGTGEV